MPDETKPTVIIVDDSQFMRKKLRRIFESGGYTVVAEAENGSFALQQYKDTHPSLMTMDIVMPQMDGIHAVKEILAFDPSAAIIMVSSLGMESKVNEALAAGAKDFILKPFQSQAILDIAEKILKTPAHVAAQ